MNVSRAGRRRQLERDLRLWLEPDGVETILQGFRKVSYGQPVVVGALVNASAQTFGGDPNETGHVILSA